MNITHIGGTMRRKTVYVFIADNIQAGTKV